MALVRRGATSDRETHIPISPTSSNVSDGSSYLYTTLVCSRLSRRFSVNARAFADVFPNHVFRSCGDVVSVGQLIMRGHSRGNR